MCRGRRTRTRLSQLGTPGFPGPIYGHLTPVGIPTSFLGSITHPFPGSLSCPAPAPSLLPCPGPRSRSGFRLNQSRMALGSDHGNGGTQFGICFEGTQPPEIAVQNLSPVCNLSQFFYFKTLKFCFPNPTTPAEVEEP